MCTFYWTDTIRSLSEHYIITWFYTTYFKAFKYLDGSEYNKHLKYFIKNKIIYKKISFHFLFLILLESKIHVFPLCFFVIHNHFVLE
jgi:hypothetical protein